MKIMVRLLGLCLLFICVDKQAAFATDWRPITKTDWAFDASRITHVSPSVLRVWVKYIINETMLDNARKQGFADRYVDYAYSISLEQVDCKMQTMGLVSMSNFNSNDRLISLSTFTIKDSEITMDPAMPESVSEAAIKEVCAFAAKRLKKR